MTTRAISIVVVFLGLASLDWRARAQAGAVFTAEDMLQVRTFAGESDRENDPFQTTRMRPAC